MATSIDTVVLAAMPEEITALSARIDGRRSLSIPHLSHAFTGALRGRSHLVAVTGEGRERASAGARSLFDRFSAERVLIIGFAGALSPELPAGRLVIAREVMERGRRSLAPPGALCSRALDATGAASVIAVTTDLLLLDARPKRELFALLPRPAPAIADLESSVHARLADRTGTPWLVVRAISDELDDAFPALLARCRRRDGSIARAAVVGRALFQPHAWRSLGRLAARARTCARRIADGVESIAGVDGDEP